MKSTTQSIVISCSVLWLSAIGVGVGMLWSYENSVGAAGYPPVHWPANTRIELASGEATLVMVAHPHCPCSRASIGELALIMTQCQGRVSAYVFFVRPEGFSDQWVKTDLWDSAARIPGVTVLDDEGGVEAARFNAVTSGMTMLYDARGELLFSGGITGSRGHSGDNDGRSAIVALLTNEQTDQSTTPVFGCSIVGPDTSRGEEEKQCSK